LCLSLDPALFLAQVVAQLRGADADGMDHVLVVTGVARGQVWMLSGEFATPVAHDFEAWILRDYLPEARWLPDFRPHGGPV